MKFRYLAMSLLLFVATSCVPSPENVSESDNFPEIYPDYIGVTVPPNIAPLNFLLRDSCWAVQAIATTDGYETPIIPGHHQGGGLCLPANVMTVYTGRPISSTSLPTERSPNRSSFPRSHPLSTTAISNHSTFPTSGQSPSPSLPATWPPQSPPVTNR